MVTQASLLLNEAITSSGQIAGRMNPNLITSQITSNSPAFEKKLLANTGTENIESLNVSDARSPRILPRSGWQNWRAFLKVLVKAKQSLGMAEITATLWD